jgi:hypothetical protein
MVLLGQGSDGRGRLLLHLGRVTTYALLGALAGRVGALLLGADGPDALRVASGHAHTTAAPASSPLAGLAPWQGLMALFGAAAAVYMAIALLGYAPSPERWFAGATRLWGRVARRRLGAGTGLRARFGAGLLWGFLPCGLVLAALLPAGMAGSAGRGALTMIAFGLGTWPVGLGLGSLAATMPPRFLSPQRRQQMRLPVAGLLLLVGVQMALRGLTSWGWVSHGHLGGLMLW